MRIRSAFFVGILVTLSFWSCETDVVLEGEWKDIPVVYAFLSIQDTAHYVRVEKAFLQPGGDANAIARNPDSLYYAADQVSVELTNLRNNTTYTMQRVDGAAEGYPRQDGVFAQSPNILYKLPKATANLRGGDKVRITVRRTGKEDAAATTTMLEALEIDEQQTVALRLAEIDRTTRIEWRPTGDASKLFDVQLLFNYQERNTNSEPYVNKTIAWQLDEAYQRNENITLQNLRYQHAGFFQFIQEQLDPIPGGSRRPLTVVYQVTGAGEELVENLRIANANIGITSSQSLPIYSNVEGGVGMVSSRYQVFSQIFNLSSDTRDSIISGQYTRDLGFTQ